MDDPLQKFYASAECQYSTLKFGNIWEVWEYFAHSELKITGHHYVPALHPFLTKFSSRERFVCQIKMEIPLTC